MTIEEINERREENKLKLDLVETIIRDIDFANDLNELFFVDSIYIDIDNETRKVKKVSIYTTEK